jgi:hypothetical protein
MLLGSQLSLLSNQINSDLPINQSGKSGNKIPVRKLGFPPWIWPPPVRNSSPECAYVISTANFFDADRKAHQSGRRTSPDSPEPVRTIRTTRVVSYSFFSAECTNVGFGSTSRHAGILPGPTVGPIGPSRFLSFFLFVICFSHVCPDSPDSPEPVRNQSGVSSRASAFVRPRT